MDIKSFDCQMKSHRSENLNWRLHMAQWLPIFISNFILRLDFESISSVLMMRRKTSYNLVARG